MSGSAGPRILAFTSGKGGVGKTIFAVNMGIRLSEMGRKVLVLDGDLGLGNVCISMGLEPSGGLEDVLFSGKPVSEIMVTGPAGLSIIPGGSGVEELTRLPAQALVQFATEIQELSRDKDYLFIDTGAGITSSVMFFLQMAHEVILITTPEPTAMADAYGVVKSVLAQNPSARIRMVINRCHSIFEAKSVQNKMEVAVKKFLKSDITTLGFVMHNQSVLEASRNQQVFLMQYRNEDVSKNITRIVNKLEGVSGPEDRPGLVEKILDLLQ